MENFVERLKKSRFFAGFCILYTIFPSFFVEINDTDSQTTLSKNLRKKSRGKCEKVQKNLF